MPIVKYNEVQNGAREEAPPIDAVGILHPFGQLLWESHVPLEMPSEETRE